MIYSSSSFLSSHLLCSSLDNALVVADEEQLQLLLGSRASGRMKGMPNFRAEEDLQLAQAYAKCSTDAATGTDQSSDCFWKKIRVAFVLRGGTALRTGTSLQNRFNKVLQAEINKYIAIQHRVLREYKSGWPMADYDTKSKRKFMIQFGKTFKHEGVLTILKEKLPAKYGIDMSAIDSQVRRALLLIDGAAGIDDDDDDIVGDGGGGVANNVQEQEGIVATPPCPSIGGKKKAKEVRASKHSTKLQKLLDVRTLVRKVVMDNRDKVASGRNESMERIAAAAEAKHHVIQDEPMMFNLFMEDRNSDESKIFFSLMHRKYAAQMMATAIPMWDCQQ